MHCVLLVVVRRLLSTVFVVWKLMSQTGLVSTKMWVVSLLLNYCANWTGTLEIKNYHEVNKRLTAIKAPLSISRLPENIQKGSSWKVFYIRNAKTLIMEMWFTIIIYIASQCQTFLLYYLPSTLHGILPDKYLAHVLLWSKVLKILLDNCVSIWLLPNAYCNYSPTHRII